MPGSKKPNIVPTRIKMSIPQGYMLGRTSPGVGPVELIPIAGGSGQDITNAQKATGQLPSGGGGATTQIAELSFTLVGGGTLATAQFYYAALCPVAANFPTTQLTAVDRAICRVPPTTTAVFYLVTDLVAYAASLYPAGVAATITFTAGVTTGTVVWIVSPTTVLAGQQLYLVCASSFADAVIEGIAITLVGDYTNG